MAWGSLFYSTGAAIAKLHLPMHLLGVAEKAERWLPCVRLLHLIIVDRFGDLVMLIALYLSRLYVNSVQYSMGGASVIYSRME